MASSARQPTTPGYGAAIWEVEEMYKINCEMLGSEATDEQAQQLVSRLQGLGYDVEHTYDCGSVNGEDDPIPEEVWEREVMAIVSAIDKSDFLLMIKDWQADGAPEYDDLEIAEPELKNGKWVAAAKDGKCMYELSDVDGNIVINYLGAK